MKRQKGGFTLIELLVVIAIIALLMSILMPALRNVRDQAKNSMCLQRLQQWGVMFSMYADDYDGQLMDMCVFNGVLMHHGWTNRMYPYAKTFEMYLCPSAVFFWRDLERYDDPRAAWDYRYIAEELVTAEFIDQQYNKVGDEYAYGSYGKNVFVSSADYIRDNEPDWYPVWYHNVRVRRASEIPLFGDCNYTGAFPDLYDEPADTRLHGPVDGANLNRFNLDRHSLSVNLVFLDWSVRKVGLRQLWTLRWNKETVNVGGKEVNGWGVTTIVPDFQDPLQWPEWMRNSKNYDL
ncbi:MAG: type II secretion system protein [Planctomycetota bacterium]|jgi:prepilin-type N-terminal cleavage/methylation domain-containing protein